MRTFLWANYNTNYWRTTHWNHVYFKFTDDMIWIFRGKDLEFVEYSNKVYKTIKFAVEYSEKKINFLQTTVFRIEGKQSTGAIL